MKKASIGENFILQTIYQILTMITPLITAPYIARVLGPDNIGINAFSYAIMNYFSMFASLGITNYGSRTLAAVRDNKEKLSYKFSELYCIHAIISLAFTFLYLLFCLLFTTTNRNVFLLQVFYLLSAVLDINWLFFAVEDFRSIVWKNCILKIVSVISILIFVKTVNDLCIYVFILSFTCFLGNAVLWINYRSHTRFVRVKIKDAMQHIKPLFILFLPVIAISIYKYIDKIMLGAMVSKRSVGFYESGEKIINLSLGIVLAFGTIMLPKISYLISKEDKQKIHSIFNYSMIFLGFISIGLAGGCYGIADDFIPIFFGEGYDKSIAVLELLAITIPFSALANIVKTQYILPNCYDRFFAVSLFIGAFINIIVNWILIPILDIQGAVIGTLITEIIVCLVQVMFSNREMKTLQKMKQLIAMVINSFFMVILIRTLPTNRSISGLIIKIVSGAALYCILNGVYYYLFHRDVINMVLNKLFKKKV